MKSKSPAVKKAPRTHGGTEGKVFRPANLMATNPRTTQFEPTLADPVRQHFRMAGGC